MEICLVSLEHQDIWPLHQDGILQLVLVLGIVRTKATHTSNFGVLLLHGYIAIVVIKGIYIVLLVSRVVHRECVC